MGKRILIIFAIIAMALFSEAQNIQLHYDMGKGRGYLTSTVEMLKPDKYGSTFFFIDMNYDDGGIKGISLAYWELARAIKFWDGLVAFHTEFNGGMSQWKTGEASGAYTIGNAYLNGIEYSWNAEDFSKGFTFQALHKYIRGKHKDSFQLTGVWYLNMFKNKLSFKGFADFWREDFVFGNETTRFVFLSEPQLWFNFSKKISLGSEIELGNNLGGNKGFHIMPTIGARYIFN